MPLPESLALMKPLLEDAAAVKIGHNIKFDCLVMARHGIRVAPIDDTMLLSYALDGGRGRTASTSSPSATSATPASPSTR